MLLSFKSCRSVTSLCAVLLVAASTGLALGQEAGPGAARPAGSGPGGAPRPIAVHLLHDGVNWTDSGLNLQHGASCGGDGVILFDPKGTVEAGKEIVAQVAKLTDKPITTVIVSHAHPDHTRGLPAIKRD